MHKSINVAGRSMIEMLGVLAIIGVLSVGGIAGFSKAMSTHKINKCTDQIVTIVSNVRSIGLRQHGSFNGLTTAAAIKLKAVPDEMIKTSGDSNTLENVFGGKVEIGTSKSLRGNTRNTKEKDFLIEFYDLPREACLQIASKDWGSKKIGILAAKNANSLKGGNSTQYAYTSTSECKTSNGGAFCVNQQMPLATANTACACGKSPTCAVALWMF